MATDVLRLSLEKVDFRKPTQVTDDTSILTLKNLVFEPLLKWQSGGHIIDFINAILDSRDTFGMKWSYERYLAHAKIVCVDDYTILLENPVPIAAILDIFTEFYVCRCAENGQPILGTGPYRVTEFDQEDSKAVLDLVRTELPTMNNEAQRPIRIIATAEPKAEERLNQLREGNVDVALNLERIENAIEYSPDLVWSKSTNTLSIIYYLNCYEGLFTSAEARMAVNHAVDTEALSRDVFQGLAVPSTTIVSPFHLGAQQAALKPISYDPVKARQLLEDKDVSKTITLRTPTYMPERAEAITAFMVAALKNIGLTVKVEVESDRAAYARQAGLHKSIGDMALFDSSPHSTFRVLDDKISSFTQAVWWQGLKDVETDDLINIASRAVEEDQRQVAYGACLKRLQTNPPWLYLVHPVEVFAARKGLQELSLDCKEVLNVGHRVE